MPKCRRTVLALLAVTILAPSKAQIPPSPDASTISSTGPGMIDASLLDVDLPEFDFTGLDRAALQGPGRNCYLKSFSHFEGKDTCAPGCCCDSKASSERTVRLVSAVGGCAAMIVTGAENELKKIVVLPWSVTSIGDDGACAKTTDAICGSLAPGCWVPPIESDAANEAEARAKREEKMRGGGDEVEDVQDKKKVLELGLSGDEIAAISVSTAVIGTILVFLIIRFMVLPWFRGELDGSECSVRM